MNIIKYFYFVFILLGTCFSVSAQVQNATKHFVVNTDYCRFWKNDSTGYLEISTAVYPNVTTLKKDTSGLHGKVEMEIIIHNLTSDTVVTVDRFNVSLNFVDSLALKKSAFLVNKRTYSLKSGAYKISIHGNDIYNRSNCDSSKFVIDILRRPASVALSDIELCSNIMESKDLSNDLYKNSYIVIPQPSCVFGSTTSPVIFTYTEFYNIDTTKTYSIDLQVIKMNDNIRKNRTYSKKFSTSNVVNVATLNIGSLLSGKYDLILVFSDSSGREITRSQRVVYLHNPQVKQPLAAVAGDGYQEFSGLNYEDLEKEFQYAKYIVQSGDISTFEKLTTVEARREFMNKFWIRVEAAEQGRTNITRAIYIRRIAKANQQYGRQSKEGWRTDCGRIYILYGEPDDIERFPSTNTRRSYEIWSYHQVEGGVQFVFIDIIGFNEYTLVHSTKRGEVNDASWQQFLSNDGSYLGN